jgi:hypothetical protein
MKSKHLLIVVSLGHLHDPSEHRPGRPRSCLSSRLAANDVLDTYEGLANAGIPSAGKDVGLLWTRSYAPLRKDRALQDRRARLLARPRLARPHCRPTAAEDFRLLLRCGAILGN